VDRLELAIWEYSQKHVESIVSKSFEGHRSCRNGEAKEAFDRINIYL
jgi:hypothetical protein